MSSNGKQVYLACGATDLRKSIDGLSAIVREGFEMDPFTSAVFVFCNRGRNRIKILEWDGDGFWIHLKRLERGRFNWPDTTGEETMPLSDEELRILLGGTKLINKIKRRNVMSLVAA
jgi:transposase